MMHEEAEPKTEWVRGVLLLALTLLLMCAPARAEEKVKLGEVIVTASKLEEPLEKTSSSVIVITKEEIEEANTDFIPEILRRVADVNIAQTGGPGKSAGVFIRGASPSQSLIMIDGVKVKSTTLGEADLSGITADDIERIEIVKGPQSTMYGSEAMGGVINIITKKGKGKPSIELSYQYGSHDTQNPQATLSGGTDAYDYRVTAYYFDTDGISTIRGGAERDGYKNSTLSGKFGFRPAKNLEVELTGKYYATRNELDGFVSDDPNTVQHGHSYIIAGTARYQMGDAWEQALTASTHWESSKTRDPDTMFVDSDIDSRIDTVEWRNSYSGKDYVLSAGLEYREESGENLGVFDESVDNAAVFLNGKFTRGQYTFNAGARYDDHETFGSETTYRVGVVQNMEEQGIRARASYATGFRAPTLNDLFYQDAWGSMGNPDLRPEKSTSWEVGLEQDMSEKATISVVYFEVKYEDLIQWVEVMPFTWQPENVAKAKVRGVETAVSYQVVPQVGLSAGYAYLDSEDKATGQRLTRRPIDKFTFSAAYTGAKLSLLADYIFVGKQYDGTVRRNLNPYNLVNLSGRYAINDYLSVFARVENLLDEDYEEAGNFGTPGATVFGGIKATF